MFFPAEFLQNWVLFFPGFNFKFSDVLYCFHLFENDKTFSILTGRTDNIDPIQICCKNAPFNISQLRALIFAGLKGDSIE